MSHTTEFPDVFPQIEVRTHEKDKMQPGLTLCNLHNRELGVPITVVVLDSGGNVRWWFQHGDTPDMRGDIDVRALREGILVGGTNRLQREKDVPPVLVDWKKKILWKGKTANHHHIHRTHDGNYMFLVEDERYFKHLSATVVGDTIVEFDPETGSVVWEWHLFDHVSPTVARWDWSHLNTIEVDPEEANLYLSARNLNSIFKVSRKTGEIVWRLGEDGDFDMPPEDQFYHQHSPEVQPNGNILLFDNGAHRPEEHGGEFSRALELSLDENAMKAEAVWSWRSTPYLFTPIWGDADRLENGNTLMVFGNRVPLHGILMHCTGRKVPTQTTRVIEVTSAGEMVWELEFSPPQWGVYRAERIKEKALP